MYFLKKANPEKYGKSGVPELNLHPVHMSDTIQKNQLLLTIRL